ncbi:MAG TPA: hypothetical protein VLM40_13835, partial [Gemmata sp.]|nr:hypothetical protein [Gemmata sp.]
LTNGDMVTIQVPAERAYGLPDPARIRRVDRARFPADEELKIGGRVWMRVSRGRTRRVRVLEISDGAVVVDANHPRCGQSVRVVVELVAIVDSTPELGSWDA